MRNPLPYALVLLAALGCCPTCPNPYQPDQSFQANPALFPVPFCRVESGNGRSPRKSLCSGTLVDRTESKGLVLTCYHCTDEGGRYMVRFLDGQRFYARLLTVDRQHDLAALSIQAPNVRPCPCGAYDGKGTFRAYGFGGNGQLAEIRGQVIGHRGSEGSLGHSFVVLTGEPIGGDSGAGTLNPRKEFCGVLWGRDPTSRVRGFITMGRPVTNFMCRLVQSGKWQPSPTFTPGGRPVRDSNGYSLDGTTRTVKTDSGEHITVDLCGTTSEECWRFMCPLHRRVWCPYCPPRPWWNRQRPLPDSPPPYPDGGRRPIQNPIEIAPPDIDIKIGQRPRPGEPQPMAVIALAAMAGIVAAVVMHFRAYG